MSKVTVITGDKGLITAIGHGHLSRETAHKAGQKKPDGGLRAGPGQKLHELDLAEDVSQLSDWSKLHTKVQAHLR